MLTLDEIMRHLQDKRLSTVKDATGVNHNYLIKLRAGLVQNPSYEYLKALSDYFENYHSYLSYEMTDDIITNHGGDAREYWSKIYDRKNNKSTGEG